MNIDALTLTLLLVVLVITVNVMMSYLRFPNVMDIADYREQQKAVIKSLRLNKMLALLNIPLQSYLASVPLNIINRQVATCRACTEHAACDSCLKKGRLQEVISFCPNHVSLLQQREALNRLQ